MLRASGVSWIAAVAIVSAMIAGCSARAPEPAVAAPMAAAIARPADASSPMLEAPITAPAAVAAPATLDLPVVHAPAGELQDGAAYRRGEGWVVGDGTPESCTAAALIRATRAGGTVRFDCGAHEHVIVMDRTLTVCNTVGCTPSGQPLEELRLEGEGRVVLAGTGERPLLYANACETALGELPGDCARRSTPHLVLEGLALVGGSAISGGDVADLGGGGAVGMRGGRLTLADVLLTGNRCADGLPSAGGAVLLVEAGAPAQISGSTFAANSCASGGALALRDTSATIVGASVVDNTATESGGGIVATGTTETLEIALSTVSGNAVSGVAASGTGGAAAASGSGIEYAVPDGALSLRLARVDGNASSDPAASDIRSDSAVTGAEPELAPSAQPEAEEAPDQE